MQPDAVRELYDEHTASTYNERWHGAPWGNDTDVLAEAIGRQVHPGVRWLDVGCGTGHFLSRFPGIDRAGTDMSPSMLAEARAGSPDAEFFQEWDFRNDRPEWRDGFTLVSCTGEPWSYVDTIGETERFVRNLSRWTAPDGTCLLAMQDATDLTGVRLPYYVPGEPGFPGEIWVKAVVWSMTDRSHEEPREHDDLIWPNLGHWLAMFGRHFRTITIETLRHDPPWLNTPRRVLLATDKRLADDDGAPVEVRYVDMGGGTPDDPATQAAAAASPTPEELDAAIAARAEAEAARDQGAAELDAARAELDTARGELARLRHEVAYLKDTYGHLPPPGPDGSVYLATTPTKVVAVELARRLNPVRRVARLRGR